MDILNPLSQSSFPFIKKKLEPSSLPVVSVLLQIMFYVLVRIVFLHCSIAIYIPDVFLTLNIVHSKRYDLRSVHNFLFVKYFSLLGMVNGVNGQVVKMLDSHARGGGFDPCRKFIF